MGLADESLLASEVGVAFWDHRLTGCQSLVVADLVTILHFDSTCAEAEAMTQGEVSFLIVHAITYVGGGVGDDVFV